MAFEGIHIGGFGRREVVSDGGNWVVVRGEAVLGRVTFAANHDMPVPIMNHVQTTRSDVDLQIEIGSG